MFTTQGGVDIEEVAEKTPDALVRLHVDPLEGFQPWQARRLIYGAGVEDPSEQKQIAAIVGKLYDGVRRLRRDALRDQPADRDAGRRGEGARLQVHGRRQRALQASRTLRRCATSRRTRPDERAARAKDVTYVKLDGQVGILGNGAGLGMSTLDVVALAGGAAGELLRPRRRRRRAGVVDALEIITATRR